jgi:ribosome-associated toxin RatA of RatAB toxin-antitoxin module
MRLKGIPIMLNSLKTIILFIFLDVSAISSSFSQLPEDILQHLSEGEVIVEAIENESGLPGARAMFQIQGTRSQIWAMLNDYQTFKQIYDDIDSLRVLKEDEKGATLEIWYNATIGKFHYVLYRNYEIPEYKLSWERVSGDFKVISGGWEILNAIDKKSKILIFESYVKTGGLIPPKLVRRISMNKARKMGNRLPEWLNEHKGKY